MKAHGSETIRDYGEVMRNRTRRTGAADRTRVEVRALKWAGYNGIKFDNYDPIKNILFDVDEASDGRIFVIIVRDKGVPASIATISNKRGPGGPLLSPYPNWSWYNDTTDCNNNIISVLRISIKCNHLFALDFGRKDFKDGFQGDKVCPPKLLIFNLENDMLVDRITIPSNIADNKNGRGLLATPLAYIRDCRRIDNATVYMSDVVDFGLVIYNKYSGFCRIESDFMKPTHPNFTIENESFYLEDGIVDLFYAPLAGNRILKMNKHTLRKCSKLSNSEANRLTKVAGILSGQTGPIASQGNVIFFSNIPETSILCADTTKKFDPSNSLYVYSSYNNCSLKMKKTLFVISILTTVTVSFGVNLTVVYKWKYVDFLWESEKQREAAINSDKYNPNSCVLYDVDKTQDDRIFVTSVREQGVPASLMTVSDKTGPGGPLLDPYPNWSWYNENDCNGIISVYRVSIKCNHIFVLDCGKIGEVAVCPPQLLIFNLKNNKLVKRIRIPPHIANNKNGTGLLVTPLAYVRDCKYINDATVFMADVEGYGLAIYNENFGFCRIESNYMKPTDANFTIENQSFYLEDGILGLTIIYKQLYYAPLAGKEIYKMDLCNIHQECLFLSQSEVDKLTQLAGTLSGQTGPIASEQCAIFFSNIPETSILCQDTGKEFHSTNTEVIAQNSDLLQFPSGMKVVNHRKSLMILTNRIQRVITDTLNLNETNFRILTMDVEVIRNETNCFASCSEDHSKPEHHMPWHDRPWYDRFWYHFTKR
ncbi:MRJP2 protein, partial [Acromyrmex heyeri]